MPRLDILLFPLLGGYIFLITFNYTRYYHQHIEKQRLLYNSLVVGFLLLILVYSIDYFIFRSSFSINTCAFKTQEISYYRNNFSNWINHVLNHQTFPGFKHSLICLVLSFPLALLCNKFISKEFAFHYTVKRWGNDFHKIIWNSIIQKEDLNKLLMLTMKNNKVYIGHITELSQPLEHAYLKIIPSLSGYRNKDTHQLQITTNYTQIIQKSSEEGDTKQLDNKLGVIIPINEILFISRFDFEIFGQLKDVDTHHETQKDNNPY